MNPILDATKKKIPIMHYELESL